MIIIRAVELLDNKGCSDNVGKLLDRETQQHFMSNLRPPGNFWPFFGLFWCLSPLLLLSCQEFILSRSVSFTRNAGSLTD